MTEMQLKFTKLWDKHLALASKDIRKKVAETMEELKAIDYNGTLYIDDEVYHHLPFVSKGQLHEFHKLPAKYYYKQFETYNFYKSPAMALGTIYHQGLLEPEKLQKSYWSDDSLVQELIEEGVKNPRATTAYRQKIKKKEAEGVTIVKGEDLIKVFKMIQKTMAIKKVSAIISGGIKEHAQFCICPMTGLPLKSKPDLLYKEDGTILDLKTSVSAAYDDFNATIYKYWYHIQAVHYLNVANNCKKGNETFDKFGWIVAEKEEPHAIALRCLDVAAYEEGQLTYNKTLNALAVAVISGEFKGYPDTWEAASLPYWAFGKE